MTTLFTLYIGLNDKDTKHQKIATLEASKIVENLAVEMFGGATIYEACGVYTHENNIKIIENTLRVEIYTEKQEKITEAVEILKKILNQECIGIAKSEIAIIWA